MRLCQSETLILSRLKYSCSLLLPFFFFFQAEDGIRDIGVTGVQTCALPISSVAFDGTPHFTNGAALVDATAYKTESGRHLSISDSSGSPTVSADSNDFTVGPAALASFSWSPINDPTTASALSATAATPDAAGSVI